MLRTLIIGAVLGAALTLPAATFAQQGGTAQEAQAMLDKAVAAVKADQPVALAMFLKGEGGFRDRDLIRSASEAGTERLLRVRLPFQLARTLEP